MFVAVLFQLAMTYRGQETFYNLIQGYLRGRCDSPTNREAQVRSGCVIDLIAYSNGLKYVVECKPQLNKSILYGAIGQVLCYCQEYDPQSRPAIASYRSEIDTYVVTSCDALDIILIAI